MNRLWHTSDIHLSFKPDGTVQKPMDKRSWSEGSPNYVGYLEKLAQFGTFNINASDFVCITGDLTHDMKHIHAMKQIEWIRNNTCGNIVLIKGNHDRYINFAALRLDALPSNVFLIDEGEVFTIGPYTFGCYSDHDQKTEGTDWSKYLEMADKVVEQAKNRDTIPVMLSHYPLPEQEAKWVAQKGIKAYLSGHVHCTKGDKPDGNDWTWYNDIAAPTDDKKFSDCFFSTGTTDVLLNRVGRIYKEISHLQVSGPLDVRSSNSLKDRAGKAFSCNQRFIDKFHTEDTLNPGNTISGFLCRSKGVMSGSLYITHVNGVEVEPQLIYGTPKLAYPYKDTSKDNEYIAFPKARHFYLAEKWNGTNILFYKYYDSRGEMFISAKTKGTATLKDSGYGNFLSLTLEALNTTVPWGEVPDAIMPLMHDSYQSMSFELCGKKEPHLVKYSFDVALKPLFYSRESGSIVPYIDPDMSPASRCNDSVDIATACIEAQERYLKVNEEYRTSNSLPHKYEYEHFAVEGKVLYLLDENGNCLDRTLYKIKPKDIEEVHWQTFNASMQDRVKEAIKKLGRDSLEVNEANLSDELDMGPKEWNKFGKDIMRFATSNPSENKKELLVLVGVPGSGKSTFAKELELFGWVRVNQDELGSRNKCKQLVIDSFKQNKKVCIDRCNFDVNQRKAWLDIAHDYNCKAVSAVVFDTPHDVCKERIMSRSDHPTVAPVEASKTIVDKFADMFVDIKPEEGFNKVVYINTDSMVQNLLETYRGE